MPKFKRIVIPALLFIFSLILRLFLISKGPYHVDTLFLAINAEETLRTHQLQYLQASGLPLTSLLGAAFLFGTKLFSASNPVFAVNLMSVCLSSLCVPLFYIVTKKLMDQKTALFGSLLFCIHPTFLAVSVYGNSHSPFLLFLLLSLAFLCYFRKDILSSLLFCGISLGLAGASRIQDLVIFFIPFCILFIAVHQRKNRQYSLLKNPAETLKPLFLCWIVAAGTILIFYLPLILQQIQNPSANNFLNSFHYQIKESFLGIASPGLLISGRSILTAFNPAGCVIVAVGLFLLWRHHRLLFAVFGIWFAVPFLFFGNLFYAVPRFFILPSIPLIITQGYLFSYLTEKNKSWKFSSFLFFLILLSTFRFIQPSLSFRHLNELFPDYARWVATQTPDNAIIIERDNNLFIEYYGRRKTWGTPVTLYEIDPEALSSFKENIDQALGQEIPLYIMGTGLSGHNPYLGFEPFMKHYYTFEYVGKHLVEDWHKGCLRQLIGEIRLYRVRKKEKQKL